MTIYKNQYDQLFIHFTEYIYFKIWIVPLVSKLEINLVHLKSTDHLEIMDNDLAIKIINNWIKNCKYQ